MKRLQNLVHDHALATKQQQRIKHAIPPKKNDLETMFLRQLNNLRSSPPEDSCYQKFYSHPGLQQTNDFRICGVVPRPTVTLHITESMIMGRDSINYDNNCGSLRVDRFILHRLERLIAPDFP